MCHVGIYWGNEKRRGIPSCRFTSSIFHFADKIMSGEQNVNK